jgi:hypothetical protein
MIADRSACRAGLMTMCRPSGNSFTAIPSSARQQALGHKEVAHQYQRKGGGQAPEAHWVNANQ